MLSLQFCASTSPQTIQKVENPKTILHIKPLGDGGVITRNLFRSFWMLPSTDADTIRVGLIPSSKTIRLTAQKPFVIRVYGEHESWDVASPGGVVWKFEFDSIVRPPVVRYLVTVEQSDVEDPKKISPTLHQKWSDRGFAGAQWVGPPKMDSWEDTKKLKRFFLTLNIEENKDIATAKCKQISQRFFSSCKVITRMDLPHLGKGVFRANHSNFEKEFEGVIEIIPTKKDFVQIFDIQSSMLSDAKENLQYSPQIFIVPNLDNELSAVQSTTLEEYLKSVVPSEIFPNGPLEALKAQAVIARTYLFQSKTFYSDKPFLTCASTQCQVYLGEKTKSHSKTTVKAVEQTKNVVLKESGSDLFAETFYHAASGGKTEIKQLALGGAPKPYLVSANDMLESQDMDLKKNEIVAEFLRSNISTYCNISRFAKNINWSYHLDQGEIAQILKKIRMDLPLESVEVLQRGISGRALVIRIKASGKQKLVQGELQIRSLFGGLPSSLAIFQPDMTSKGTVRSLSVIGRGSGHGVGLSQLGAIGRAMEGQNYEHILHSYYPGTILTFIEP